MSIDGLVPGEHHLASESFSPNMVLFWLKVNATVTNKRIVARQPNTLLGMIPLGYENMTIPLRSVAGVGVSVKFSLGQFLFSVVLLFLGLSIIADYLFPGLVITLLGVVLLLGSLRAALKIENTAGSAQFVKVAVTERAKLEQFRAVIDQRIHSAF